MFDPKTISRFKKEKYLKEMLEDDFRDQVIRPLYFRLGFKDGRDFCGSMEKGKDCLFVEINSLQEKLFYCVQTKRGNLNMSKTASENVIEAIIQLKTALNTTFVLLKNKQKRKPDFVLLITSGKINDTARNHISDEIKDTRIKFQDSDDIIPLIDSKFPEFWIGIDANKIPYFKNLKEILEDIKKDISITDILSFNINYTTVTDQIYIPLYLSYRTYEIIRRSGQTIRKPVIKDLSIEEVFNLKESLLLILGEAGTGKSTALKRLAYILCNQKIGENSTLYIPILLRSIDIIKHNKNLVTQCIEETQKIIGSNSASFTTEDLEKGNVIVLIDALDELTDEIERKKILQLINDFNNKFPDCKIILTSRNYTYLKQFNELNEFKELRLSYFNLSQAKKMVEKLIKSNSLSVENSQEIIRRLKSIHGIDLTPLLITVFVASSDFSKKDIPANITELFKKYTEMMLGRWDRNKGLNQQFHAPLKDFLLSKIAYEMHIRNAIGIKEEECIKIMKEELKARNIKNTNIDQLINESLRRSGLFKFIDDMVEFRHLLLQEFFAGRGIPSVELIPNYIKNQWWQRAIVFYFGENPKDIETIEKTTRALKIIGPQEQFQVAITVGLSIQACYLVETIKKIDLFKWVLQGLSLIKPDLVGEIIIQDKQYPLTKFIAFYLFSRDAVACDFIEEYHQKIINDFKNNTIFKSQIEMIEFWIIVSLIECGYLEIAEKLIKKFHPKDNRLLLALHLGCFYVKHTKISSKENCKIAERICNKLTPNLKILRLQLIDEFKSELLEIQKDKIKALNKK